MPRGEEFCAKTFLLSQLDSPARQREGKKKKERTIVSDGSEIKGQC